MFLSEQRRNRHFNLVQGTGLVVDSKKIARKAVTCHMHPVVNGTMIFESYRFKSTEFTSYVVRQVLCRVDNLQLANLGTRIMCIWPYLPLTNSCFSYKHLNAPMKTALQPDFNTCLYCCINKGNVLFFIVMG